MINAEKLLGGIKDYNISIGLCIIYFSLVFFGFLSLYIISAAPIPL